MVPASAPALVMGLSPTGLHAVRVLGRAGVAVTGMDVAASCGRYSRHLRRFVELPAPGERLDRLCSLFPARGEGDPARAVLIATSDRDVEFVCTHAAVLAPHYAFQHSYRDGSAMRILDKQSFYALCAEHGVAYPASREVSADGLTAIADAQAYPCVVKPAQIHRVKHLMRGRKVWIAADAQQLRRLAASLPDEAGTLLVQDIVPGPESEISLFCAHVDHAGEVRQAFTARKLRQYPPGFGSASLAQSCPEPETAQIATRLLRAIGYRGIAALEFKRDIRDGQLKVIEMNPRTSLWFALAHASDRPVVLSAYRELAGIAGPLPDRRQTNGVRWRDTSKDITAAAFYRVNRDFVLPAPDIAAVGPARRRVEAVFDRADPAPVLGELRNRIGKLASRTLRRPAGAERGR